MKKYLFSSIGLSLSLFLALGLSSCQDDDFTASIYDTKTPVVDPSQATAPFDQWLLDNYVKTYNTEVVYKFNLSESDLDYQLIPAGYEQSQLLARLVHYLYYQPYAEMVGDDFLRQNSPRQFQFVGSVGVNAMNGTWKLGYASGGIKITLMNVNGLNMDLGNWTKADMLQANEDFFHTIHHEFSHILHQRKTLPSTFKQITSSTYDPLKWQERDSVTTHQLGYTTNYGSSAFAEDFVETLSCTITDDDDTWMTRIINATLPGVRSGDKQRVLALLDSLEIKGLDDPAMPWNNFEIFQAVDSTDVPEFVCFSNHINMLKRALKEGDVTSVALDHPNDSTYVLCGIDSNNKHIPVTYFHRLAKVNPTNGDYKGFKDYLQRYVKISNDAELAGMNSMLRKLDMATEWYTTKWGLYLYTMRHNVQTRQDNINQYMTDSIKPYIFKLN